MLVIIVKATTGEPLYLLNYILTFLQYKECSRLLTDAARMRLQDRRARGAGDTF